MDAALDQETSEARVSRRPRAGIGRPNALTDREPVPAPEALRVVSRQVRAGTYRPHVADVAELLIAWHFVGYAARRAGSC